MYVCYLRVEKKKGQVQRDAMGRLHGREDSQYIRLEKGLKRVELSNSHDDPLTV